MIRLRTVIVGLLGLLVIAGVVIGVALYSIDARTLVGLVQSEVRQNTGRELAISGPVDVALLPRLAVRAEGVTLANAPGGSRPAMLTLKRIELDVAIWPLLRGQVVIDRLVLVEPDLLLEPAAGGRGNWQLPRSGPSGSSDTEPPVFPTLGRTLVEGGTVTYRGGADGESRSLDIVKARLERRAADRVQVAVSVKIEGVLVDLTGTTGSLAAMVRGAALPLDLKGSFGSMTASIAGVVEPAKGSGRLQFSIAAPTLSALGPLVPAAVAELGPVELAGEAAGDAVGATLSGVRLRLAGVRAAAEGTVSATGRTAELTLEVSAGSAAELGRLAQVELPATGPVDAKGIVRLTRGSITIDDLKARIGDGDLAGSVSASRGEKRPRLTADLVTARYELPRPAPAGDTPKPRATARGPLFDTTPFDLGFLSLADVDAKLTIGDFLIGSTTLGKLQSALSLADGVLTLERLAVAQGDAQFSLKGSLAAVHEEAQLAADGVFRRLDVGRLLAEFHLTDELDAKADGRFRLSARGVSPHALAASLDGHVVFDMGPGTLRDGRVELIARDLVAQLLPWSKGNKNAQLNCLLLQTDIVRGVADPKILMVDTERMTMAEKGALDLGREDVDMILAPHPKQASFVSLAVPIRVRGPLVNPTALPDPKGVALGVAGAVAGTAINPLGALLPFLSAGGPDQACQETRAAMAESPPKTTAQPGTKPNGSPGIFQRLDSLLKR